MKVRSQSVAPFPATQPACAVWALTLFALAMAGCGDNRPPMAPVKGVVRLDGKPLSFGGVLFQPETGFPAQGAIESDGSFTLSTYEPNDGAVIGSHRVQVTCYEGQDPKRSLQRSGSEEELGRSLVPERYTYFASSGLMVEVKEKNDPVVIELSSK